MYSICSQRDLRTDLPMYSVPRVSRKWRFIYVLRLGWGDYMQLTCWRKSLSVIYFDEHRDMVLSTDYDGALIRPLPIFVIASKSRIPNSNHQAPSPFHPKILHLMNTVVNLYPPPTVGFHRGAIGENDPIPLKLYHGPSKDSPIYATTDQIERHSTGTLYNHAYDPKALFATTKVSIDAHLTKERCDFDFLVGGHDGLEKKVMKFRWKQCKGDPQVMELGQSRAMEAHDWSWFGRENKKGMKLFCWGEGEDGPDGKGKDKGEVLAVFVAGKKHSKMNPVRIAAKVRWLDSKIWTDEVKLAAFLALMTYGEKTRRVGTGAGA